MTSSSSFDLVRSKTMKINKPTLVAPDLVDENDALDELSFHDDLVSNAFSSLQSFLLQEKKLIIPQNDRLSQKFLVNTSHSSSQVQRKKSQPANLAERFTQQINQAKSVKYDYKKEQKNFDERYDTKSKQIGEWEFYVKSEVRSTKQFYHFINAFRLDPETGGVQVEAIEYDAARDRNIQVNLTHPTRWADGTVHQFFSLTQQRALPDIEWKMRSIRAEKIAASGMILPSIRPGKKCILEPGQAAFYAFLAGQPGALRMSVLHTPGQKLDAIHITKGQVEDFYEEIVIHFIPDGSSKGSLVTS